MSEAQSTEKWSTKAEESLWGAGKIHEQTRRRLFVLLTLAIIAAVSVIIWVVQEPLTPTTSSDPREGDLAFALLPVLAAALGINLFLEMGFSLLEQYDLTLVAQVGHGQRWLEQAKREVERARQWQLNAYAYYNHQLEELDKITQQITKTEDVQKAVEAATVKIKAARDWLDVAEARTSTADSHLDSLVNHPAYRRFKSSVATYFSILLGLLIATATSMQIFTILGVPLGSAKMDTLLTGLFIGGLVYPVHQVIGNVWDILTKLAKK